MLVVTDNQTFVGNFCKVTILFTFSHKVKGNSPDCLKTDNNGSYISLADFNNGKM